MNMNKLFDNKRFLLVFSIVFAVTVWFISMFTIREDGYYTIEDVPVKIDTSSSIMQRLGLEPVDIDVSSVEVEIEGKPYVIGNVSRDDVEVTAVLSGITEQGTYNLTLVPRNVTGKDFNFTRVTPDTISVKFDHMVTRKFSIQPEVVGAEVPDGFIMQGYIVSPSEITVTGPEKDVERVKGCVVTAVINDVTDKTVSIKSPVVLVDENGNAVENEYITMDAASAEITVPILKKKELPLRVDFLNQPPGFKEEDFDYTLSVDTIEVAGAPAVVDNLSEVLLGYVDFKTLDADARLSFNLTLPATIVNLDNVETVEMDFDREDMISKTFNIRDIRVVNAPAGYDVAVSSTQIRGVRMTGYRDVIESLSASDIVAEVDMSTRELATGQFMATANIFAPSKARVWANGDYSVMLTIKEKAK